MRQFKGFTLIEVLLALMLLTIGMTALLKSMGSNIRSSLRLKEKTIEHVIAMNALAQIQLHTFKTTLNQEFTSSTSMAQQNWYWRAKITPTSIKTIQKITVSVSNRQVGPFTNELVAFRYAP